MKAQVKDGLMLLLGGIACFYLANGLDRSAFWELAAVWLALSLTYGYTLMVAPHRNEGFVFRCITVSMLYQLIFFMTLPILSDDFYRYIWDGLLLNEGVNPYVVLPQEVDAGLLAAMPNATMLYEHLNSPAYFTIYPPIPQALFAFSCWLFPANMKAAVVVLQLFFLMAQLGVVVLVVQTLRYLKQPVSRVLVYAMNPLIIVELVGNLHLEVVMLLFLSMAFYLLLRKSQDAAAFFFGCAVATKLIPLVLLPVLVIKLGWKRALRFTLIVFLTVFICFLPFLQGEMLFKMGSSIDLYFRTFEFNASIYYVVRAFGYWIKGYNLIQVLGPLLAGVTLIVVLVLSFRRHNNQWNHVWATAVMVFTVYFLLSTTVHPWYLATPLLFSVFTPRYRFIPVWTITVVLSYAAYSTVPYSEREGLLVLEYLPVLLMLLYDVRQTTRKAVFTKP